MVGKVCRRNRIDTAVPAQGFGIPPYHVESFVGMDGADQAKLAKECNEHGYEDPQRGANRLAEAQRRRVQ